METLITEALGKIKPTCPVDIVSTRERVEIRSTSNLNRMLGVERQLFEHPVVVGLFNVDLPRFPLFNDLCDKVEPG